MKGKLETLLECVLQSSGRIRGVAAVESYECYQYSQMFCKSINTYASNLYYLRYIRMYLRLI